MKVRKKYFILAAVSVLVVSGTLLCYISSLYADNVHEDATDVIKNISYTEEEKSVLKQENITNIIEETLNGYEFESDEKKEYFRDIMSEHFKK
ncbi:MAG: hypothetical protein PUC30_06015 [Lachnospiraceae bacterium]|nr:hypothetical protein [Lachnospiraceae bacterium]